MLNQQIIDNYLAIQDEIETQYGAIFSAIRKSDMDFVSEYNPNHKYKLPRYNVSWEASINKEKINFNILCYDGGGGCDTIYLKLPRQLLEFKENELLHYFENYYVYQEKEKFEKLLSSTFNSSKLKI
jgi:hypothetical protein